MRRRFGLLTILLASWSAFFWWTLPTVPHYSASTRFAPSIPGGPWAEVVNLSNDGRHLVILIHESKNTPAGLLASKRLERWDLHSGARITLIGETDWRWESVWSWYSAISDLAANSMGFRFLCDEAAWLDLRERMKSLHARSLDTGLPLEPDNINYVSEWHVNPTGQYLAYVAHRGLPVPRYDGARDLEMVIEDRETGRRIAWLPKAGSLAIASNGQTAVYGDFRGLHWGAPSHVIAWNLTTGAPILETELRTPFRVYFGPDSRAFFMQSDADLKWWSSESGELLGSIAHRGKTAFMAGGKVLVTSNDSLAFWDVASGQMTDEWKVAGTFYPAGLASSNDDRFLAATFKAEGKPQPASLPFIDWLLDQIAPNRDAARWRVFLFDVVERRKTEELPGGSALFSANGRWLATDDEEAIRVWEIPLRRPWLRILLYALLATLATWGFLHLLRHLARQVFHRRQAL